MDLGKNIDKIEENIRKACLRCGRKREEVRLLAVTKSVNKEVVEELSDYGQVLFGENKVQVAEKKIPFLPKKLQWHFIGRIQTNKINKILNLFEEIHGINSLETAKAINERAKILARYPKVYLQVNITGELSKAGFNPIELKNSVEELVLLDRLEFRGLMLIPPFNKDAEETRKHFRAVSELKEELEQDYNLPLAELSMGMSHDYPVAIEEGSTIVRVGSAFFRKN